MMCAPRSAAACGTLGLDGRRWIWGDVEMRIRVGGERIRDAGRMIGIEVKRLLVLINEVRWIEVPSEIAEVVEETDEIVCLC